MNDISENLNFTFLKAASRFDVEKKLLLGNKGKDFLSIFCNSWWKARILLNLKRGKLLVRIVGRLLFDTAYLESTWY